MLGSQLARILESIIYRFLIRTSETHRDDILPQYIDGIEFIEVEHNPFINTCELKL